MFKILIALLLLESCGHNSPMPSPPLAQTTPAYCSQYIDIWPDDTCNGRTTEDDFQCAVCHSEGNEMSGCIAKDIMIYCVLGSCSTDNACAYR